MEDDSYFYAQIAYNIGVNRVSSFDGINVTSGYHLLWGWLLGTLSFIVSFFSLDKDIHLYSMFVLYCYIAINLAYYFGKNVFERLILFAIAIFLTMLMETGLLSLLLLVFVNSFVIEKKFNIIGYFATFLIPLARIDAVLFFILPIMHLFVEKESRKIALKLGITVISGVLFHFVLMYVSFAHFFSVSSLIKAQNFSGVLSVIAGNITGYTNRKLAVILLLIGLSSYLAIKNKRYDYLATIGSAFLFLFLHVATNSGIRDWYYMPVYMVILFIVFRYDHISRLFIYGICFLLIFRWGYSSVAYRISDKWGEIAWQNQFVYKLKEIVPPESRLYLIDGSGWMGYFSERTIINGDGLVNSYDYYYLSQLDMLEGYLEDMQIDYIITNLKITGNELINYHGLVVYKDDVELLIDIPDAFDGGNFHNWRLYKLKNLQ